MMNAMSPAANSPRFDVVGLGETMLSLFQGDDPTTFAWDIAGAESNVVRNCAALGLQAAWASALGDDRGGSLVYETVAASGADLSLVRFDEVAPTGLMIKAEPGAARRVTYHRRGSAASQMSVGSVDMAACLDTRVLHLTGITPALSPSCHDLVTALLARPGDALRSFDVNWRPALWPDHQIGGHASDTLAALANSADVVFVGLDEAEEVWGIATNEEVRALIDQPRYLIAKDGAHGVTVFDRDDATFVSARRGTVVDPMGAGDAFVAGFLTGFVRGFVRGDQTLERCARLGHIIALSAVESEHDVGTPPDWPTIERLLAEP